MKVQELARRTGLSPRSVRHDDRNGLLGSIRLANGYREFPAAAVGRILIIKLLLDSASVSRTSGH